MGLTDFRWYVSGLLLALNTFGPQCCIAAVVATSLSKQLPNDSKDTGDHKVYMFLFVRAINAWIATCSVALQRRHLMVWALFAPKFVFELCFLFVADLFVLAFV